ncbi:MAG TPA: hypothetical protein VJJ52_04150 [Candidatus Nanoarchaeia archaeon]|nr:hypothetical protein [Candidatus Nanoarchaeia archaeon]
MFQQYSGRHVLGLRSIVLGAEVILFIHTKIMMRITEFLNVFQGHMGSTTFGDLDADMMVGTAVNAVIGNFLFFSFFLGLILFFF